jgi:hypothetical protein
MAESELRERARNRDDAPIGLGGRNTRRLERRTPETSRQVPAARDLSAGARSAPELLRIVRCFSCQAC